MDAEYPLDRSGQQSLDFHAVLTHIASSVMVIATCSEGVDHTITATTFTPVSFSPPLALICVRIGSQFETAVRNARAWSVSVLREADVAIAERSSARSRTKTDHLDGIPHSRCRPGNVPVLDSALVGMTFRTTAEYAAGDHMIVLGHLVELHLPSDRDFPLLRFHQTYSVIDRSAP
ncbi:flavin reductase family protein [Kribbella sp. NPDC004536]|uniref:flavin reductase family protein n=1 Tax=Kribbella sp. NPDC004536 TaxID=3364106 RepID=UPI0036A98DEC